MCDAGCYHFCYAVIFFKVAHYPSVITHETVVFAVVLAGVFAAWYASEGTLSIHSIYTTRREMFYWATVIATFALGTAAGDFSARTLALGWLSSGVMYAVLIAVPAVGYWRLGLNPIVGFWFAYSVTRPLGASFADYAGLPHALGGLGIGRGTVSVALTVLIVALVGYLAATHRPTATIGDIPETEILADSA